MRCDAECIEDNALPNTLICNYFHSLVNCFFKILPLRESEEDTLEVYIDSLKLEMTGCGELMQDICYDPQYMTLLSILQYFSDHPDCETAVVRREVFRAIRICNKIAQKYSTEV